MKISLLKKEQIAYIYNNFMIHDFPSSELKPLSMMMDVYDKGVYECYVLFGEEEEILAYAFFFKNGKHYLFDYLAVTKERRNSGIGSVFLEMLRNEFSDSDSVIGEVEDPDYAKSSEERDLQTRRLGFYMRNGYVNTDVKVEMFDVDYIIIEMDLGMQHSREEIADLYASIYKAMLPEKLYKEKVKIK